MFTRFSATRTQRRADKLRDDGFTLIELLVVVIIIGILAAIAIPIYLGVQNNAKDSAVKADLNNIKAAVVTHLQNNNGQYTALTTDKTAGLGSDGFTGYSVDYTSGSGVLPAWDSTPAAQPPTNASSFCISAVSPTGSQFYVTDSGGVVGPVKTGGPSKPGSCG